MKKITLIIMLFLSTSGLFGQEPFLGEIKLFAGNFAPRGWAFCDGQLLPINQNTALFSILGTTYGGDGRTTFALPDLRGRVAINPRTGPGLTNRQLGERGGAERNTLTVAQMPAHNHNVTVSNPVYADEATSDDPKERYPAVSGENMYHHDTDTVGAAPVVTENSVGGSQPVNNMQPYTCINYIICLQGIFPSRN